MCQGGFRVSSGGDGGFAGIQLFCEIRVESCALEFGFFGDCMSPKFDCDSVARVWSIGDSTSDGLGAV